MSLLPWMVHAAVAGTLVAGAAWFLDRALTRTRLPTRWVWVAALALSAVVPSAGFLLGPASGSFGDRSGSFTGTGAAEWLIQPVTGAAATTGAVEGSPMLAWPVAVLTAASSAIATGLETAARLLPNSPILEAVAVALWLAGSLLLLTLLLRSRSRMMGRKRHWSCARLRGRAVRIAPDLGPAVVGLFPPEIVMPAWAESLNDAELDLVLAHEEEHVRAHDPLLLHMALFPLCLLPWSPAVWWQLRRLRDAVEVDCDRRLLRRGTAPARYGRLLLRLGSRGHTDILPAPALSASPSLLERRLKAMKRKSLKTTLPLGLLAGFIAVGLIALACEADAPLRPMAESPAASSAPDEATDTTEDDGDASTRISDDVPSPPLILPPPPSSSVSDAELPNEPVFTPYEVAPRVRNAEHVQQALEQEYPPELRDAGIGGTVILHFFITEEGTVDNALVHTSSGGTGLDEAAVRVAYEFEFTPAQNQDEAVPVWVQIPITFQTS